MDCEQFDQIVIDLLYGEADDEVAAEAKRHADQCDRCAPVLRDLRATKKAAVLPLVEAPSGFEEYILDAARQVQREIPWPRRIGRWISWAGGYAMRPQLAMAALLLLMIGSSLLLIRGRPGSEQVGVVRVTEQGVPEREGAEPVVAPDMTDLPLPAAETGPRKVASRGKAGADPASPTSADDLRAEEREGRAGDAEVAGSIDDQIPSPTGNRMSNQQLNSQRDEPSAAPPADDFARAMELYRAGKYASAYRAFDAVAMSGGANAASAALHAAMAVRASSGCPNALPRFESVATRFGSSGAGVQAKWEAASCARIMGDYTRARILYRELARIESQRDRAEHELSRLSNAPSKARAQQPAPSGQPANQPPGQRKTSDDASKDNAY